MRNAIDAPILTTMRSGVVVGLVSGVFLLLNACSKEPKPSGAGEDTDPDEAGGETPDDFGQGANSLAGFDPIFNDDGTLDCEAYGQVALADDIASIDRRLGPGWHFFHPGEDANLNQICAGPQDGVYRHDAQGTAACSPGAVDWTGFAGQILYVPDASGDPGIDRSRLIWSEHGDHGGAEYWHCYRLAPIIEPEEGDGASWLVSSPDPGPAQEAWVAANGGASLERPVAVGRARLAWSNVGIVAFRSGLVGATGYGNNDDRYPYVHLGANKVPTAVAVTPNNEFALVTVWDTAECRGQLAVIALEARALEHHSWYYAGLPNAGTYTRLKVLGFVDLPIAAPSSVATSVDIGRWNWMSPIAGERLDTQEVRDAWAGSVDGDHTAASAGYAVIASRAEGKVVFVDLEPLLQYLRSMYFTSAEKFEQTMNEGDAPDEWPFAFSVVPDATPVIAAELEIEHPTVVAAGLDVGDRNFIDAGFVSRAYVATVDGKLHIYDVGGLNQPGGGADLTRLSTHQLCNNPTDVSYGRGNQTRDELAFVCRGDRELRFVAPDGTARRTLSDRRLLDPVAAFFSDSRGADVISVGDFAGRQVANYLHAPINSWGEELFGGLCEDGNGEFEFTGALARPGAVFQISVAEVN